MVVVVVVNSNSSKLMKILVWQIISLIAAIYISIIIKKKEKDGPSLEQQKMV